MTVDAVSPLVRQAALLPFTAVSLDDIREARLIERHGLQADPPLEPRHAAPPADALTLAVCVDAVLTDVYGVHDRQGHPYSFGVLWRNRGRQATDYARGQRVSIQPPAEEECRSLPSAFYVPFLFDHFGHTLTEVCSAIYPLLCWMQAGESLQGLRIIVHRQFVPYLSQLTELLAVEPEQILVPGFNAPPLRVSQLVLAVPTYVECAVVNGHHPACARILLDRLMERQAALPGQPLSSAPEVPIPERAKVYVSRSRLPEEKRHLQEEEALEQLLQRLGWTILHPQEHALRQQLAVYQRAGCVCAVQGSALHLLLGVERDDLMVIMLSSIQLRDVLGNSYTLQFDAQGLPYHKLNCLDYVGDKQGANRDQSLVGGATVESLAARIDALAADHLRLDPGSTAPS